MLNFVNIFKEVFPKDKKKKVNALEEFQARQSPLFKRYDSKYLNENFEIPLDLAEAFILFVEREGYKESLLMKKNEMYLIGHLHKQSKRFLKLKN